MILLLFLSWSRLTVRNRLAIVPPIVNWHCGIIDNGGYVVMVSMGDCDSPGGGFDSPYSPSMAKDEEYKYICLKCGTPHNGKHKC